MLRLRAQQFRQVAGERQNTPHQMFAKARSSNARAIGHYSSTPGQVVKRDAIRARRTIAWFDGMLWGREKLLTGLVQGMVRVRRTEDGSGSMQLRIANRSPVPLSATLQVEGSPRQVEVAPHSEVLLEWADLPELLPIRWDNVWINPRENLVTRHSLRAGS